MALSDAFVVALDSDVEASDAFVVAVDAELDDEVADAAELAATHYNEPDPPSSPAQRSLHGHVWS